MLIVHEIMGRHCGWLTAAASNEYRKWLETREWNPSIGLIKERWDIHAIFLPELKIDIASESHRLRSIMDEFGNVNIFLSEGAGVQEIIAEMEAAGEEVERDPFGHVKLDTINPGEWFAKQFAAKLGAEKVMVQKSGYFSRSAKPSQRDLELIASMVEVAVDAAARGEAGVVGHDEERNNELRVIEFPRIAGGKAFDTQEPWFVQLLETIGQPLNPATNG